MAETYLDSASGVTAFAQSTAYVSGTPGDRIVIATTDTGTNYAEARKWVWECTTSGTTAAANPTWPATVTQDTTTVTSGTATFTARKPGFSSGTTANWAFATIYDYYALGSVGGGDTLYIASGHVNAGTPSTPNYSPTFGTEALPALIISVDKTNAPPTALASGAKMQNSGGIFDLRGYAHFLGITFSAQSGAGTPYLYLGSNIGANVNIYENCSVENGGTATNGYLMVGSLGTAYTGRNKSLNTNYKMIAVGQKITLLGVDVFGGGLAAGSSAVTTLFSFDVYPSSNPNTIIGFDASIAAANVSLSATAASGKNKLVNIKLPASWTGAVAAGYPRAGGSVELIESTSGTSKIVYRAIFPQGDIVDDTGIYLTTGYSKTKDLANADLPYSLKVVPRSGYVSRVNLLWVPLIPIWVGSTGAKTLSIKVAYDSATALKDYELPIMQTFSGTASSTHHTADRNTSPSVQVFAAGTSLTDTTEAWTGTSGWTNKKTHTLTYSLTINTVGYVYLMLGVGAAQTVYVNRLPTVA